MLNSHFDDVLQKSSSACNFNISTILVLIVRERQNQVTVRFGLLTLFLNTTVLCTSSVLDSNQRYTYKFEDDRVNQASHFSK